MPGDGFLKDRENTRQLRKLLCHFVKLPFRQGLDGRKNAFHRRPSGDQPVIALPAGRGFKIFLSVLCPLQPVLLLGLLPLGVGQFVL